MTTVYLVRHAEAEGNLYRRIHGWYDSRVTSNGLKQLELLKERFTDIHLDAVYSSDLLRARLTAGAVSYGPKLPVMTTDRLREVNMGVWEDKTWGEIITNEKEQYLNFFASPDKWNVDGCEHFFDLQDRMEETVTSLAADCDGGTIALVTHGCAIRSFLARIKNVAPENIRQVPYSDNTGITILKVKGSRIELITQNDASHIPDGMSRFRKQKWRRNRDGIDDSALWFRRDAEEQYTVMRDASAIGELRLDVPGGRPGNISYYCLDPLHRGQGLSAQLLGQAVSVCRNRGLKKLTAELHDHPELMGYFEHYGFVTADDPAVPELDISLDQSFPL
ncbi:MAG: GNAT family N-acetyltransferase [Oscillospiraceae bacterium]|nr:GNAT family N-acetyltransferase [Oscillospiraceae bacterium]